MPIRVQRKRTKGYRLPPNTISVCRPGRFGNPFRLTDVYKLAERQGAKAGIIDAEQIHQLAQQLVVDRFAQLLADPNGIPSDESFVSEAIRQRFVWMRGNLGLLKGKNLACFCALLSKEGKPIPCHADTLLLYSNDESLPPLGLELE
ncbi:DUF4326 domain-containing protein [Spirosoma jeollabukense]